MKAANSDKSLLPTSRFIHQVKNETRSPLKLCIIRLIRPHMELAHFLLWWVALFLNYFQVAVNFHHIVKQRKGILK